MDFPISGVGTVLKRNTIAVARVRNIGGPSMTRDTIDITSFDSVGGYREFISSFRDGGEVPFDLIFTLDGYDDFKTDFEASTLQAYSIELPDSNTTTFSFNGLVTALGLSIPMDDAVMASVTIKISGQVTLSS